jgi:hypothetical protein
MVGMALATLVVSSMGLGTAGQYAQGPLSSRSRIHSRRSGYALAARAHQPGSVGGVVVAPDREESAFDRRLHRVFLGCGLSNKLIEGLGKIRSGILREALHDFGD